MPFFYPFQFGMKYRCLILCGCLLLACEDQPIDIPDGALDEHTVDLGGTWKVKQVLLNNRDITSTFDFNQITLTLKMDAAPTDFEISTGTAPFPVVQNGKWEYNDLAYPTSIFFNVNNTKRSVDFSAPPISGDSSFKITFSLGCQDNLYTYYFDKQ